MNLSQKIRQVYREKGGVVRRGIAKVFPYYLLKQKVIKWNKRRPYVKTEGRRLRQLRGIHAGQRCFIIGNGPSIRKQDLTILRDEITFVCNWFVLYEQYEAINPKYYCVAERGFFNGTESTEDWYRLMMKKAQKAVKFFNFESKGTIESKKLFEGNTIFYVNFQPYIAVWKIGTVNLNVNKHLYIGDTVIMDICLPIAFYMGFKEFYLLGCDCDLGLDKSPDYSNAHFYDETKILPDGQSTDYLRNEWVQNIFKSYEIFNATFQKHGRKIYNAGVGGKLEIFERVNLEDVVKTSV